MGLIVSATLVWPDPSHHESSDHDGGDARPLPPPPSRAASAPLTLLNWTPRAVTAVPPPAAAASQSAAAGGEGKEQMEPEQQGGRSARGGAAALRSRFSSQGVAGMSDTGGVPLGSGRPGRGTRTPTPTATATSGMHITDSPRATNGLGAVGGGGLVHAPRHRSGLVVRALRMGSSGRLPSGALPPDCVPEAAATAAGMGAVSGAQPSGPGSTAGDEDWVPNPVYSKAVARQYAADGLTNHHASDGTDGASQPAAVLLERGVPPRYNLAPGQYTPLQYSAPASPWMGSMGENGRSPGALDTAPSGAIVMEDLLLMPAPSDELPVHSLQTGMSHLDSAPYMAPAHAAPGMQAMQALRAAQAAAAAQPGAAAGHVKFSITADSDQEQWAQITGPQQHGEAPFHPTLQAPTSPYLPTSNYNTPDPSRAASMHPTDHPLSYPAAIPAYQALTAAPAPQTFTYTQPTIAPGMDYNHYAGLSAGGAPGLSQVSAAYGMEAGAGGSSPMQSAGGFLGAGPIRTSLMGSSVMGSNYPGSSVMGVSISGASPSGSLPPLPPSAFASRGVSTSGAAGAASGSPYAALAAHHHAPAESSSTSIASMVLPLPPSPSAVGAAQASPPLHPLRLPAGALGVRKSAPGDAVGAAESARPPSARISPRPSSQPLQSHQHQLAAGSSVTQQPLQQVVNHAVQAAAVVQQTVQQAVHVMGQGLAQVAAAAGAVEAPVGEQRLQHQQPLLSDRQASGSDTPSTTSHAAVDAVHGAQMGMQPDAAGSCSAAAYPAPAEQLPTPMPPGAAAATAEGAEAITGKPPLRPAHSRPRHQYCATVATVGDWMTGHEGPPSENSMQGVHWGSRTEGGGGKAAAGEETNGPDGTERTTSRHPLLGRRNSTGALLSYRFDGTSYAHHQAGTGTAANAEGEGATPQAPVCCPSPGLLGGLGAAARGLASTLLPAAAARVTGGLLCGHSPDGEHQISLRRRAQSIALGRLKTRRGASVGWVAGYEPQPVPQEGAGKDPCPELQAALQAHAAALRRAAHRRRITLR